MTPLVVDASAVLTLVLDPTDRGERVAEALLDGDLHAPDLLPYELSNVVRRRFLAGALTRTEAALARAAALSLPVELWPHSAVSDRAWELVDTLTAYDAAYVALAEHLGAPLVTADARLGRAPGPTCEIRLV